MFIFNVLSLSLSLSLSRIIQSFIMREQSGALAPPQYDEHKLKLAKKGGIMATVFTGKSTKSHRTSSEMTIELSLEMNRKMQSVLEDTLLKNITLKVRKIIDNNIIIIGSGMKHLCCFCVGKHRYTRERDTETLSSITKI